jgi:hypothetical protein
MSFALSSARLAAPLRSAAAPSARVSAARRPLALSVRAEGFAVGQAVKVKEDVLVYHIPKTKGAEVNLKGMSGVVDTVRLPLNAPRPKAMMRR